MNPPLAKPQTALRTTNTANNANIMVSVTECITT